MVIYWYTTCKLNQLTNEIRHMRQRKSVHNSGFEAILNRPEIQTWRAILEAQKNVFAILESNLQKIGYTVPRFQVMFYLYFDGPLLPSVLADRMVVSRGNITAFLKRLMDDKIVKKASGRSESRPKYGLTAKGKRDFEKIFPPHAERVGKLVPAMTDDAINQLRLIKETAAKYRSGEESL